MGKHSREKYSADVKIEADDDAPTCSEIQQEIVSDKERRRSKRRESKIKQELIEDIEIAEPNVLDNEIQDELATEDRDAEEKPKKGAKNETGFYKHLAKFNTYEEYKRIIKHDPECGLTLTAESRHLSLPFHILNGKFSTAIRYIIEKTVGKMRKSLNAVVFAIGDITRKGNARLIDEQACFHIDVEVKMIVFPTQQQQLLKATVQHVSSTFIALLYMDVLSAKAFVNQKLRDQLGGVTLQVGDEVMIKCRAVEVRGGACTLIVTVSEVVGKEVPAVRNLKRKHNEVPFASTPPVTPKRIKFEYDDENE